MRMRHYDPGMGRFTSVDPLGLPGPNPYSYALNNPITMIDPLGLDGVTAGQLQNEVNRQIENMRSQDSRWRAVRLRAQDRTAIAQALRRSVQQLQAVSDCPAYPMGNIMGDANATVDAMSRMFSRIEARENSNLRMWNQEMRELRARMRGALVERAIRRAYNELGLPTNRASRSQSNSAGSSDPNQKLGPGGFGDARFVAPGSLLSYRVDFENEQAANAPAQVVTVTDHLDEDLDWSSFELTQLGFGDHVIDVPAGAQHFEWIEPMRYNDQNIEVHIEAGIDQINGLVYASFASLLPDTGLPPDVLTGFLPPEDGSGRGMGYLTYILHLKADLATGSEIRNVALITFDFGETIATNQIDPHDPNQGTDPKKEAYNTIDAGAPESQVTPLAPENPGNAVIVAFSGQDEGGNGSGIANYDVYVSKDGQPPELWLDDVTETSATFLGEIWHSCAFYSVATDQVKHVESAPAAPDAQTTLVPEVLGAVDFIQLEQLDPSASGDLWYRIETTHSGLLTLEALFQGAPDAVELKLYDLARTEPPLAVSAEVDGHPRIDQAVGSGETYLIELSGTSTDVTLRLANLPHHVNTNVTVYGTDGDDTFEFDAAASRDVTINGVRYPFDDAQVESVAFDGGDGDDTVILDDSIGDDMLTAEAKHAVFANSDQTPGFVVTVDGFEILHAYTKSGGHDRAFLHDSDANDKFKSEPAENYAKMYGGRMYNRVKFYDHVEAFSSGEKDLARLFDTQGNDVFEGQRDVSRFRTAVFDVGVHNFRRVIAYAPEGGNDVATLKDSALKDEVHLKGHKSEIFDQQTKGEIYKITARRFDTVHADGSQGAGYDKVKIWETIRDNRVEAADNWAQMFTQRTELEMVYDVLAFEFVKVRASTGGNDTANVTEPLQFDLLFEDGWDR